MLVVDASVIVKIFVDEPDSHLAEKLYGAETRLAVPAHAFAEAAEVVSRKMRAGYVDDSQMIKIVGAFEQDFEVIPLEGHLPDAIRLSNESGASVYDCLYVVLAATLQCAFVTADRKLIAKMTTTRYAPLMRGLDSFTGSP